MLARSRMLDRQRKRMQRLPTKETDALGLRASIDAIAEARMTDRGEMDANLMHPAGLGFHPHQRRAHLETIAARALEAADHRYLAHRVARHMRSHRHLLALDRMPPDRSLDRNVIARDDPHDQGEIDLAHASILELARERR